MTADLDAFFHHPELRGKIIDPLTSFFRTFSAVSVFEQHPELGWVIETLHTDAEREHSRAQTLANHVPGDLWVFAYGSLMWDPAFKFEEIRRARLAGYARRFVLKDIFGGRGTKDAPGLMAALDRGECCEGLLFRIAAEDIDTETEILWRREMIGPGYIPTFVATTVDGQLKTALTFVADHGADAIVPDLTREDQIRYIASGAGFLGTSKEYLSNIVSQFATIGIVDQDCSELLLEVDAHLSAQDQPTLSSTQEA
jgi:cation transport protein ChaC